jgi:hypothetical protein
MTKRCQFFGRREPTTPLPGLDHEGVAVAESAGDA